MSGPVLVFGAHRSGSTALARALNRHPDLMIWGEHAGFINKLAELDELVGRYPPLTQPLAQRGLDEHVRRGKFDPSGFDPWRNPFEQADFRDWCRRLIETSFRRGLRPDQRWGFKEVRYHSLTTARFLATLFPDASFIILRRDLASLVLSNMLTPWSIFRLRRLGASDSEAQVRAAVRDCAYALCVVDSGFAQISAALPARCCVVLHAALREPEATMAAVFGFLGLPHWPALLEEVRDAAARQLGVTDLTQGAGHLTRQAVLRLLPDALAEAQASLAAHGPDLARLRRLTEAGRYSFLIGDHELVGTPLSTMF